ncbi:mitochondrial zinc maintenance protein 1, mitochondrial [Schizothecium vesticola]|uniref:Mitochondrial zinc maintenance protein 1, mitochondrial n=1 Tax=Schizothecium vesticola TaxID=314040 RepID=A0AA40F1H8_9PEZI|nr:mitochondrial zinc maintenance protein 1, mitochondrial [Schizothecium vesticola]
MSLQAYRNLMRAARIAFQGDARVLAGAQQSIRMGFRDKASLSSEDPEIQPALKHAEEVAQFLRTNLVQGEKEGDVYKLNIHKDIERGDNDTVKLAGKTVKIDGKKCSDL